MSTVVVVGGGISGLAAAWELSTAKAEGVRTIVLDAGDAPGGVLGTVRIGGTTVDAAADAFVARRPEAVGLCRELGWEDELEAPGARGAVVWARGRLRPLPADLALGVPTHLGSLARSGILGPFGLARAAVDLARPGRPARPAATDGTRTSTARTDVAVGPTIRRYLGREVVERLADPLVGGITAGSVEEMSAAAMFPPLVAAAGRGSLMRALRPPAPAASVPSAAPAPPVFLRPPEGMASLPLALAEMLGRRGIELRQQARVETLTARNGRWVLGLADATVEADAVVLAVPAGPAATLLSGPCPEGATILGGIPHGTVVLLTAAFGSGTTAALPEGTGMLVPATQGMLMTAATWMHRKWPPREPSADLVRISAGRAGDPRAAETDDGTLVTRLLADLRAVTGIGAEPDEVALRRFPDAFPQYRLGHLGRMERLDAVVGSLPAPLALAGPYLHGVGVPACIASGRAAARSIEERGWPSA